MIEINEQVESTTYPLVIHITTVPMTLYFLSGQIGFLKKSGFRVSAIASSGRDLREFGKREQIPTYAIEMERRITPLKDILSIYNIWKLFRKLKPLIVDAHTPKGGLVGIIGAWLAGVPVRVYHLHGLPLQGASGYRFLALYLSEIVSCRLANRVICVSESLRQLVVDMNLCPSNKAIVLHHGSINGVDAAERFNPERVGLEKQLAIRERYRIPINAKVVGFVGRVVPDKGIAELTEAWKLLQDEHPSLHLLIVGGHEAHTPLPDDVEYMLQNNDRIHLAGHMDDVVPLYSIMDVFVFPSYREGFGVSIIEASAMSVPVVVNRITGCINAVIDGVTGTLIEPRNPRVLADAITLYLSDPLLCKLHGQNGREWVSNFFQPTAIWEATVKEYSFLLGKKGLPLPENSV